MRGTSTEGNVEWNRNRKEQLKEKRKKLWQSEQVEEFVLGHKEPLFIFASLSFTRIGSWSGPTRVPMIPMPLKK